LWGYLPSTQTWYHILDNFDAKEQSAVHELGVINLMRRNAFLYILSVLSRHSFRGDRIRQAQLILVDLVCMAVLKICAFARIGAYFGTGFHSFLYSLAAGPFAIDGT
jgi:hypothetical protein